MTYSNRMGFSRKDGFCSSMKEGSSSSAKRKKKKQADHMSARVGTVFPEPEVIEDDCDLGKRLDEESCNGENECLWLSSDSNSPSSFFSEYRLYDFPGPQLTLDEWMISWLQVPRLLWFSLGCSIGFFDGSRMNPIQEACLVLEKNLLDTEKFLQEDLREEEVVTWLISSIENDASDSSSLIFSESSVSSFEESTGSESPSTPFRTHLKPSSSDSDLELDRTGFWVPLVDLDGEDFKWISDSESVLESSDFPSPSYKTSSSSSVSVADDLEDFNTDGLLFWPSKQKPDWNSKNWDCFSMSPRKNSDRRNAALIVPHTRKTDTDEVSRRFVFTTGSTTASKILAWKRRSSNKGIRPTSTTPSRLSKPSKTVPLESNNNVIQPTDEKALNQIFLEEEFTSNEQLSIETLLGLDEFDGHEGVDSEFNKDDFSFDQSLCAFQWRRVEWL